MRQDIRIASPCTANWDRMVGDDRVRHCAECNLNVYNFSAMTSAEVEELISAREGRLCGRLYQRGDGTILTKDCPVAFQAKIRRISRVAGATLTAIMSVTGAAAQTATSSKTPTASNVKQEDSEIKVAVYDPSGAMISAAHIRILDKSEFEHVAGTTDQQGNFRTNIAPGIYVLSIDSPGFKNLRQTVEVIHSQTLEVHLTIDIKTLMGVVVEFDDIHVEPETINLPFEKLAPTLPGAKPLPPPADKKTHP